jgi:cell division protein FtsB
MKEGHEAEIYTLDDDTEIIQEYDRFLAPRLSLINPQDDFLLNSTGKDDFTSLTKTVETLSQQIKMLLQENSELRKQLTTLSGVL